MSYQVPAADFEHEYVVKKSRFIARLVPVLSREEAMAGVAQARRDYPDARHHCWAFLIGRPEDAATAGMNDDGEPSGTAGKPILNVLQHGHLGDVLVIVIRYFGGIKLGAGGLVRAYGNATQQALELAPVVIRQQYVRYRAVGDFSQEQSIRHWLGGAQGELIDVQYSDSVAFTLDVSQTCVASLENFCAVNRLQLTPADG
ncbi:MAG: YigZ family protein [Halioglobus sp.]